MKRKELFRKGVTIYLAAAMTVSGFSGYVKAETEALEEPLAFFDFETEAEDGVFDGKNAKATVTGGYELQEAEDGSNVLYLDGSSGFLTVTDKNGDSLLTGKEELMISYDAKPGRTGTNWAFYTAPDANKQGSTERYIGALVKNGTTTIERYNNTYSTRPSNPSASTGTGWSHVDVVLTKKLTVLYVDGVKKSNVASKFLLSDILGNESIFQIGKANWGNGEYYQGWIDNFTIKALIDEEKAEPLVQEDWDEMISIPSETNKRIVIGTTGSNGSAIHVTVTEGTEYASVSKGNVVEIVRPESGSYTFKLKVTASLGAAEKTQEYRITIPAITEKEVAQSLVIPKYITGNLQSEINGMTIQWKSDNEAIAEDGTVTLPKEGSQSVLLTATFGNVSVSGEAELMPYGGTVLTYVTKGNDLLAYADSRRSDALYVAVKDDETGTYEELNKGNAILYVKWNGSQKTYENWQMGSPAFFRKADGTLGIVASANNKEAGIYIWDSKETMTFENETYLKLNDYEIAVSDPKIIYDNASGKYKIFWKGPDETEYVSILDELDTAAEQQMEISYFPLPVAPEQVPEQAEQSQSSEFIMTKQEYETLIKKYGKLYNTGVDEIQVQVDKGQEITLPETVTAHYSDGTEKQLGVVWNEEEFAAIDTSKAGTYEIEGIVKQSVYGYPFIEERADPYIFYNEEDGYYYATGSHYPETTPETWWANAGNCYRAIGLRRSKTLSGLQMAEESLMFAPETGDQWGSFIWAPEFHKINGTWYCLVGAHNFGTNGITNDTAWGWCSSTILIPYIGDGDDTTTLEEDVQAGGMLDKEQWGKPIVLEGAPSFDVSYYYDEANKQGYYILPYTPSNGSLSIVKARSEGVPQFDGPKVKIKEICWPWEYGIQENSITESNPEGMDQGIVEGPYLFEYGDKLYISYSGGTVDKYYCIGLMMADKGSDLTNPESWTGVSYPVLSSYDTVDGDIGGASHVGAGHNAFTLDEYGNIVLIYHARPNPDPHAGKNGAGGLYDPCRNTMVKSVNVAYDGTLVLNMTADEELDPAYQTVKAVITVGDSKETLTDGDVNEDGSVDTNDVLLTLQAATGEQNITEEQKVCADLNGDGGVTAVDALLLLKKVNGRKG